MDLKKSEKTKGRKKEKPFEHAVWGGSAGW
jgi:hypothetical protein